MGNQPEDMPEIGVRSSRPVEGQTPQAGDGIEVVVSLPGLERGFNGLFSGIGLGERRVKKPAILCNQEEQHPINHAQDLAIEILGGQLSRMKS